MIGSEIDFAPLRWTFEPQSLHESMIELRWRDCKYQMTQAQKNLQTGFFVSCVFVYLAHSLPFFAYVSEDTNRFDAEEGSSKKNEL